MPASCGADDSIRHQQGSLCHAQRHHGRKEKGNYNHFPRVPRNRQRAHAARGENLRPDKNQKDGISDRATERNSGEARGKAQVRSAGDLMKILVITQQRQGKWNNTSFETIAAAQQIAKDTSSTVAALVIGKGASAFANELAEKNVAEVLLVEHDLLEAYTPDGYCIALSQVIHTAKPDLVLFPHTYQVRDFAPK